MTQKFRIVPENEKIYHEVPGREILLLQKINIPIGLPRPKTYTGGSIDKPANGVDGPLNPNQSKRSNILRAGPREEICNLRGKLFCIKWSQRGIFHFKNLFVHLIA